MPGRGNTSARIGNDAPRLMVVARGGCAVGVQHLQPDGFAGGEAGARDVGDASGRIVGLVGGDLSRTNPETESQEGAQGKKRAHRS